ncbi:surfeit locus 1 family protein [Aliiroseovarius halocynthiae]|uniref:SURF1-like protein n=1 Tax=Aliiroseovarius halocynthiae TaxID=985055 RepID=A0A545SR09_9RHOB|nr:SURF1 family protein [Aliiroseovarius halocynthiae]TQV67398.1 SURF1 family protein [Aliiroseovarius halocynthiae]SMR81366.1 surfeit locus 1 family protein [Aliiroseovarius halocynthiae]
MRNVIAIILSLAVLALFIGLGTWQLQRMKWKEGLIAEIDARIAADPVSLPENPDPIRDKYLPVELAGEMTSQTLRVLVSTKQAGAGYRLISALQTDQGAVLIDRGFIRVGQGLPLPNGNRVTVVGNLHWPDERDRATPENDVADNTWFARDIDQMAQVLGTKPVLVVARQMAPPERGVQPLPVTSESIPNRHLEYVGTWFLLALTWSVMTLTLLWRKKRRNT